MTAAVVQVSGLGHRYGRTIALDGVSLPAAGGVTAVLGPNGAGKTTLLRCLATVMEPTTGTVHVDGLDCRRDAERVEIRRRLGYLPQAPGFPGNASVFDVVEYLAVAKGHRRARARRAEVFRVLDAVGLRGQARQRVRHLSGGMRRRLGIAQALLGRPALLVLDEPAAGLDPEQRLVLRDRLSRAGEESTVVVSTHLTDEAAAFAQRLWVLLGGRVAFVGAPADLVSTARGRVWEAPTLPAGPHPAVPDLGAGGSLSWRTPEGRYRGVGEPPPGARSVEPGLEDAYLLLAAGHDRRVPPVVGGWPSAGPGPFPP